MKRILCMAFVFLVFSHCRIDSSGDSGLSVSNEEKKMRAQSFVPGRYYKLIANEREGLLRNKKSPKWLSGKDTCKVLEGDEIIFKVTKVDSKHPDWMQVYVVRHIEKADPLNKNLDKCTEPKNQSFSYKWIYLQNFEYIEEQKIKPLAQKSTDLRRGVFGPFTVISLTPDGTDENVTGVFKQPLRDACFAAKAGNSCLTQNVYSMSAFNAAIRKLYQDNPKAYFGNEKLRGPSPIEPNIVYCKLELTDQCLKFLKGGFSCLFPTTSKCKNDGKCNCKNQPDFVSGIAAGKKFKCDLQNTELKKCIVTVKGGGACVPLHCAKL